MVQYRHTLDSTNDWTTLTNFLSADSGTNITFFTDPNPIEYGSSSGGGSGGGSGGMTPPGSGSGTNYGSSTNITVGTGFYRVVRDGVYFFGLTNDSSLSGVVTLPVEAGYSQGTLDCVTISANGSPIEGTPAITRPFSQLAFNFDTRRLSNGDYYLQAMGMWSWDSTNAYDSPYAQLYSPSILVHITNSISFPDWVQDFRDNLMLIKVTSVETNTDWQIDVYGEHGDYVGSFTNHTDDGVIDISWDLRDSSGNLRTDSTFSTVTRILDPSTATNPPLIRVIDNYPDEGKWVVARADYIPSSYHNYNYYVGTVNGFAEMGESAGGVLPATPFRNAGEAFFVNTFTNAYRWVWIDSCNSALGAWPRTFGLGTRENVALNNYTSRPGAFCGFTHEVYGSTGTTSGGRIDINSINYRGYFLDFWWILDNPLKNSFDEAALYSGATDSDYLKIYGYWGLHWDELNTKGEWPP